MGDCDYSPIASMCIMSQGVKQKVCVLNTFPKSIDSISIIRLCKITISGRPIKVIVLMSFLKSYIVSL